LTGIVDPQTIEVTLAGDSAALFSLSAASFDVGKATDAYVAPSATQLAILTIGTVDAEFPNLIAVTASCPYLGTYYYTFTPSLATDPTVETAANDYVLWKNDEVNVFLTDNAAGYTDTQRSDN